MKPIFAVYEPAFIGLVEKINLPKETIEKYRGEAKVESKKRIVAYLHGKLEGMAGFDIPQLLAGTVTELSPQQCLVILPNGTEVEAILSLTNDPDGTNQWYGLITLPDDLPDFIK